MLALCYVKVKRPHFILVILMSQWLNVWRIELDTLGKILTLDDVIIEDKAT